MSGGETSLSGNDNNAVALTYAVGQELLYINGVLQIRGTDYVATTGTTITGITALVASDVVDMWSPSTFNVANTYTTVQTDLAISQSDILSIMGAI
jgi:hypothetical protein